MKKAIIGSLLMLIAGLATAQENGTGEVPVKVVEAFNMLYPQAKSVSWNYAEPHYEATFKTKGKSVSAFFDEDGSVSEVKNEIMLFELPVDVNNLLARDYSGWRVGKALHVDVQGTAYYETVVEKEKQTITLVFNRAGGLMIKVVQ